MKGNRDDYRADAPVSARDRASAEAQVVFYQLTRKFVDDERSIPEASQDVLYYTLSVGHHTGVIDCFEEKLRLSSSEFKSILSYFEDDEEAHYKLAAIERGGEVTIERPMAKKLEKLTSDLLKLPLTDPKYPNASERTWLEEFRHMLYQLINNQAAYIIGRRRER